MAIELGIASKSGAWFNYGDTRIGQGRENAKTFLDEHPDITAEMEARIRDIAVGPVIHLPADMEADDMDGLALAA